MRTDPTHHLDRPHSPSGPTPLTIFDFGTISGEFETIDAFALGDGLTWDFSQLYTTGTLSVAAIPEPTTLSLGVCALVGTLWRRRRNS